MGSGAALAQEVRITAPGDVIVGAPVEIRWAGPEQAQDFISIDAADLPPERYGHYVYANRGQPAVLRAPEVPGRYLIRYHSGSSGYAVLGQSELTVQDSQIAFGPLDPVAAGASIEITWEGPVQERDFISIDTPGDDDRRYGPYGYARTKPLTLRAPDTSGTYLIRYHLGESYRVIGQTELVVGGVSATLTAPERVPAGSDIEVRWEGPNGHLDYLSIDPAGAAPETYGYYQYAAGGNPVTLVVPEEPGSYEIRYHMGQTNRVIGSRPVEVLTNTATIAGPASATGGAAFQVSWTGPDNRGDFVTIVEAGAEARAYDAYAYTRDGATLTLTAPLEPGTYELRYLTGQQRRVLASAPIEVLPGLVPGTVRVLRGPGSDAAQTDAVEVILDASGSMLQRLDGERRIEIARRSLTHLIRDVVPPGTPFALRVFGHREVDSCRTDLEIPLAPLDPAAAMATVGAIQAQNLARTPIADSLSRVQSDLSGVTGAVVVVLITDGEDTCDGDPGAAIEALGRAGFDVRLNIVGFAIDELALVETFRAWASSGGGRYVEANDAGQLTEAMSGVLQTAYELIRDGEVVARGVVDGDAVAVLPGEYGVRLAGGRPLGTLSVVPGTEQRLVIDG